jgi:PAS domain S-box-containing protein
MGQQTKSSVSNLEAWTPLFELSPDLLTICSTDGAIIRVNRAAEQITGRSEDELLSTPWIELIDESCREVALANMQRLLEGEEHVRFRIRVVHVDGTRVWMSFSVVHQDGLMYCTARNVDDKVRLERELDASYRRYQALVDIAPVGIFSFNAEGQCDYVNNRFLEIAGWNIDVLKSDQWIDYIHSDDRARVLENWRGFQATGRFSDIDYRQVRPQGEVRHVRARSTLLTGEDGKPEGIVGILSDVTDLNRANEHLLETATLGRVGGWEVEARTMRPTWTLEMRRIFEVPDDYVPTLEGVFEFFPPEVQQLLWDAVQGAQNFGRGWDVEVPAKSATGRDLWVRVAGKPEMVNGTCVRIVGIVQDLTEQHAIRQEERSLNQKLQLLYEHSPFGIVLYDLEGRCAQANAAFQKLVDYDEDELQEMRFADLVPREFKVLLEHQARELKATGQFKAIEKDLLRRDGSRVPVFMVGCLIHDHKDVPFVWALVEDVSLKREMDLARVEQERLLNEANQALAESNRELEEFTYAASHDLREPLRTIASFCELLEEDLEAGKRDAVNEDLRIIRSAARRLQNLVQDLLQLSRSGKSALKLEATDLNECLKLVRADLRESLTEAGAVLEIEQLPTVCADEEHITRVFQNLISNAMKYQPKGQAPRIRVHAQPEGDMWAVRVTDNGIGIPLEYQKRVFDAFKRLHGQHEYEGSGIGLAICKKTVERHGGRILIDSEPGKGSTFTVLLPDTCKFEAEHSCLADGHKQRCCPQDAGNGEDLP